MRSGAFGVVAGGFRVWLLFPFVWWWMTARRLGLRPGPYRIPPVHLLLRNDNAALGVTELHVRIVLSAQFLDDGLSQRDGTVAVGASPGEVLPVVPKEGELQVSPAPCYGQVVGADVVQPGPVQVFWFLPVGRT